MRRFLVILVLFVAAVALLRRLAGLLAGSPRSARPERTSGRREGRPAAPLVRDRVCNTFLAADRALRITTGGETLYFCSEACRSRYLDEGSARTGAA